MVEHFIRTLKGKVYKYFTAKNNLTYIDVLPQLVKSYDNIYHHSIKMKPTQVTKANDAKVWETLYGNDVNKRVRFKFAVGDRVRISEAKRLFEKSYPSSFTEELFTVYKRMAHQVPVYKLQEALKGFTTGPLVMSQTRTCPRFSRLHFRLFQVHPKFLGDSTHMTRSVTMRRNILASA